MNRITRLSSFALGVLGALAGFLPAQESFINDSFTLRFEAAGIVSLQRTREAGAVEYIQPGETLGHVLARYKMLDNRRQEFQTRKLASALTVKQGSEGGGSQHLIVYNGAGWYDYFADLELTERFRLEGDVLYWTIHFRNLTHKPIEIGDFILPLSFRDGSAPGGARGKAESPALVKRGEVRGPRSYLTWSRPDAKGPVLVMTPLIRCPLFEPAQTERNFRPVEPEYQDAGGLYLHSAWAATGLPKDAGGRHTSWKLTPKFTPGDEITYGFKFRWAKDEADVRRILAEEGIR